MPRFETNSSVYVSPKEFVEECSEEEREGLESIINESNQGNERDLAIKWFRGELDLKKLLKAIGKENVEKILNEL